MTAQTYQTDDGQLIQEHDQVPPEDNLMEPDAHLAVAEPELAEPEAEPMASDSDLAEPEAYQGGHEYLRWHPEAAVAPDDHESATSIGSSYPDDTANGDDRAEDLGMADHSPRSVSPVSVAFTTPEPVAESRQAGNTATTDAPWNEVQAMFVDDPRASVERAAGLVDDRVKSLTEFITERQHSMQSAWQADDAGTEELRVALRRYRAFWNSLEDLLAQA
jgi:hypothetical protein